MNPIVVAIDFSESSINAFLHALSIAQNCKKDITLVWVQKSESDKDKFETESNHVKEVEAQFEELVKKYQPDLPANKINWKIRTGKVYKEIADEAKESNAMMVVTGTHGASVFVEFWIGSNANRIISLSPCPVITIRSGIDIDRPLKRILLPIDSTAETRQKASFTSYLTKQSGAEVVILSVYTTKIKEVRKSVDTYAGQVAMHMEEEGVKYTLDSIEADNLSDSLIKYAKSVDANLIAIMSEQESSAKNIWMGPYTQQIVNRSPIPVLVIHTKSTAVGLGF